MKWVILFAVFGLIALWLENCTYTQTTWKIGEYSAKTGELEKFYAPIP